MIMELPPDHRPHWKHIFREALLKAWDIFKGALRTVTLISLLFRAFSCSGNVADSLLYRVGTAIEPATRVFGLGRAMTGAVSRAEALAFMCACTFNIPCAMALSTTYRESHSLK